MIHAEIYRKMLSSVQEGDLAGLDDDDVRLVRNDWPGLFDYYWRYFYQEYDSFTDNADFYDNYEKYFDYFQSQQEEWQHQLIAAHYLNTISEAIYEFGDGAFTREDCEVMALKGLRNTVVWDQLENQQEIINEIDDLEFNGIKNCQ